LGAPGHADYPPGKRLYFWVYGPATDSRQQCVCVFVCVPDMVTVTAGPGPSAQRLPLHVHSAGHSLRLGSAKTGVLLLSPLSLCFIVGLDR
jgi:hypothetical protein